MDLREEIVRALDGAGDELREKCFEEQEVAEIRAGGCGAATDIYDVCDGLECVEGYADGEDEFVGLCDGTKAEGVERGVDVIEEEAAVFEKGEDRDE